MICADFATSLTRSTMSGVVEENGRPCGLLSFTDLSWRHFDSHNSRVLRLGESRLWNFCRKPHCAAVTGSVLITSSTAAVHIALSSGPTKINSNHQCTWWLSVWKQCIFGNLVFKFQNRQVFSTQSVFDTARSIIILKLLHKFQSPVKFFISYSLPWKQTYRQHT
jgi:hypothetical protein